MRIATFVVALFLLASSASAQVSVPNTFVTGGRILASEVNANFDALESGALNRAGGTITGNIVVDSGITIDGIDVGAVLGGTGTPTFASVTATTFTGNLTGNVTGNVTGNASGTAATVTGATQAAITSAANLATVGTIGTGTWAATYPLSAKVGTYTATSADRVLTANGTFTITLYAAAGNAGRMLEIKNIGSGVITIDGNGAELIDGAATQTLDGQYFSFTLVCDGTGWSIL